MFKLSVQTQRRQTVATGVGLAALGIVAVLFVGGCAPSSPGRSAVASPAATSASAGSAPNTGLTPLALPDLAAKGLTLPQDMTLYRPSASDISSSIPTAKAISSARTFYPFVKLGGAQLVLMTDSVIPTPRLAWVVTVDERPTFMNGPAGAPTPDLTRPAYWLVFVDAHTGEALFGQSGEKVK